VRRAQPVDVAQIATLRAWSLRLRVAASAFTHLASIVLSGCAEAGLVGPAGDALQELGTDVAQQADDAAETAGAAADELDRHAAVLLMAPQDPAGGRLTGGSPSGGGSDDGSPSGSGERA
jgi:hypothetical protein